MELAKKLFESYELEPNNSEILCNLAAINAQLGKYNLSLDSIKKPSN